LLKEYFFPAKGKGKGISEKNSAPAFILVWSLLYPINEMSTDSKINRWTFLLRRCHETLLIIPSKPGIFPLFVFLFR